MSHATACCDSTMPRPRRSRLPAELQRSRVPPSVAGRSAARPSPDGRRERSHAAVSIRFPGADSRIFRGIVVQSFAGDPGLLVRSGATSSAFTVRRSAARADRPGHAPTCTGPEREPALRSERSLLPPHRADRSLCHQVRRPTGDRRVPFSAGGGFARRLRRTRQETPLRVVRRSCGWRATPRCHLPRERSRGAKLLVVLAMPASLARTNDGTA